MEINQEVKKDAVDTARLCFYFILGVATCGIIASSISDRKEIEAKHNMIYPNISEQDRQIGVDINEDGLEDVVLPGGKVMIRQTDGTFIPLREIRQREVDSTMVAINEKYTLRKEEVRNSFDNLDYKINSGTYVIGGIK